MIHLENIPAGAGWLVILLVLTAAGAMGWVLFAPWLRARHWQRHWQVQRNRSAAVRAEWERRISCSQVAKSGKALPTRGRDGAQVGRRSDDRKGH